jgi:hypothetical protein
LGEKQTRYFCLDLLGVQKVLETIKTKKDFSVFQELNTNEGDFVGKSQKSN